MGKETNKNGMPVEGYTAFKKGTYVDKYQIRDLLIKHIENVRIVAKKQKFSKSMESIEVTIELHKEAVEPMTMEILSRHEESIDAMPYEENKKYVQGDKVVLPNGTVVIIESLQ